MIGKNGMTTTVLRPSGRIDIEGQIYQAMSTGDYIESGEKVMVFSTEENQLVVKKV